MKHVELGAFSLAGGSSKINLIFSYMWKAAFDVWSTQHSSFLYITVEDATSRELRDFRCIYVAVYISRKPETEKKNLYWCVYFTTSPSQTRLIKKRLQSPMTSCDHTVVLPWCCSPTNSSARHRSFVCGRTPGRLSL